MKSSAKQVLRAAVRAAKVRAGAVGTRAMGRERTFRAHDAGEDTFVFEDGVWAGLDAHASVLVARKRDLRRGGGPGWVLTVTTGNHSVAALPLLQGQFWDLCRLSPAKRGEAMTRSVLCGNVVAGKIELSQRDVPCGLLVAADAWLRAKLGFSTADVVMAERNDRALEHFRRAGEEWRVKPLAWTAREMSAAIAASRKRISSGVVYHHGARGVHYLTHPAFSALAGLARTDFPAFCAGLHELVSVFEGHETSMLRQPKFNGYHEVELFGLARGVALERLVPALEILMEGIVLKRIGQEEAIEKAEAAAALFKSLLTRPELADPESPVFVETLYMHLTGEIHYVMGAGVTPAFDDRRTALPGAKFEAGRPVYDPLCDARSRVLLSNLRQLVSRDERIEYANVYELRTKDADDEYPIGEGTTREVMYKTDRRPTVTSLVEKRLAKPGRGYGSYVLARTQAFKALGVSLPKYRLLHKRRNETAKYDFFIRTRCEGEPMAYLPANLFQKAGEFGGAEAGEDPQVVLALAFHMGDAAAQNLAMKKYDAATNTPLYAVGKEIYKFGYDVEACRQLPKSVSYCSVRGSLGWPDISHTDRNLEAVAEFYASAYAAAMAGFAAEHQVCGKAEIGEKFLSGFEFRLRAMEWAFALKRDDFEDFAPGLNPRYGFRPKWRFALWALERHVRRLDALKALFRERLANPPASLPAVGRGEPEPKADAAAMGAENAQSVLEAIREMGVRIIED